MRIPIFFGIELVVIVRRRKPYRMIPFRNPDEVRVTDASDEESFGQVLARVFLPYDRGTGKMEPRFSLPLVLELDDEHRIIKHRSSYTIADRRNLHDAIEYACTFIERVKRL